MQVKSSFKNEEFIPVKYTCDGEDISPPLEWDKVDNAKTYAIIVEDPDAPAGTFIHWVIYNIKGNSLPENVPKKEKSEYGIQGINDFERIGYNGPCPPRTHGAHRYYFNVYALDTELDYKSKITADELKEMMEGHILATGSIMGKYKRK
ncbi:MAG: YbhB/YbcL family Raf kinase inhibitor-like protein [Acidianus infernus]|uniref:YbhB/YbcL family Raf kinase inhibitor-like protein n=1 Tax=Acidianus infernus TaxID=12915 RepID=UPI002276AFF9|nr:YbhB/YbcL family Raf kinase inhibitor-like protein [Acidianus infernus]MCY0883425.1 YbhB/YbcL family Raf kinase inhibitor-like protein [Acidianus infernus]